MAKPEAKYLEDLGTDGRMLIQIFNKLDGKARMTLRGDSQFPDLLYATVN